jgi:hypothetical protein
VLKTLNFSSLATQLMLVPIYACAAISSITICIASDRLRVRGLFLASSFVVAGVGWLVLLLDKSYKLSFGGTFLIGIGTYPCVILVLSWANSNFIGFTKRYEGVTSPCVSQLETNKIVQRRRLGHYQCIWPVFLYCRGGNL